MKKISLVLTACLSVITTRALNLPGPLVYVVTPSPRTPQDEGRSAPTPFYYNNWMRRMDTPKNTTTTTTPKADTPDLIFAEFESGNNKLKSIRKLLEKEKIEPKSTTTTSKPIYVPEYSEPESFALPFEPHEENKKTSQTDSSSGMEDYFYNQAPNKEPAPVYQPTSSSTTTSTTTPAAAANVDNIWHIIDNEKYNQYSGKWDEVHNEEPEEQTNEEKETEDHKIDENFALPGFASNHGTGAENESRAIRTESTLKFPYVNLKTFQMKNPQMLGFNSFSNSKKGNTFTNLDNFQEVKNPVRGEAQDVVMNRQPIDRYNPAQPYLPDYGKNIQKQSSPDVPKKAVANLIPPPPPPPPSGADLMPPQNYDSFPPYVPAGPPAPPPPPAPRPASMFQPPAGDDSDSDGGDDGPPMDLGYRYKTPSMPQFVPTIPPPSKPFSGYSYDKPAMDDAPVKFKGYSYDKPPLDDSPPMKPFKGYSYDKPPVDDGPPPAMEKPYGYPYSKPSDDHPPSYGPHSYHEQDYPELVYDKPHGGGMKGGDDMKGSDDMGMMPPPPPAPDMMPDAPADDSGFPHDFPGDFKYHDFDDHDHYHHHHHPTTTTTTTTTETPRVNRYSYYYLGKKLYYLPLYFSVYFIIYVGALIIKAVLRHKIVYPNSWRPNDQTSSFFAKRSADEWHMSNEKMHEITGVVSKAIATAAEKYINRNKDD